MTGTAPRILIVDDLFGRQVADGFNRDRANLCGMYRLRDVTGDEAVPAEEEVLDPLAEAVFFRGQQPRRAGIGDTVENDLEGTVAFVRQGWMQAPRWSLVLLDLCFYTGRVTEASDRNQPGMPEGRTGDDDPRQYFGLRILERLHTEFPDLPVVILSSKQRDEVSLSFAAHGALGFIPRSDSSGPERLAEYLWRHGLTADPSGEIAGQSLGLLLALRAARRAAVERRNVLVRGERGVGKELLAAYINRNAQKGAGRRPLVTVDSGALQPNLFASELFGHVKGAYTGADRDREGRIAQADGGDLFLDEIGNMPPDVQTGLLRVLETRVVTPLGAGKGREVDVRFIAATNEDIEVRASSGAGFRADLLDRLREGGTLVLPPLRERREDVSPLAERFVREAESAHPGALRRTITPEALSLLTAHDWPGNVRELRNCIHKAVNDHRDVEHLVAGHLGLPQKPRPTAPTGAVNQITPPELATGKEDLPALIARFAGTSVDPADPAAWAGRWEELQRGYATVTLKCLRAALFATRRVTLEHPEGEIKIHPAVKLLTGDATMTATRAADLIKRIFAGVPAALLEEMLGDPLLRTAHDTAVRLRPRSPGQGGRKG